MYVEIADGKVERNQDVYLLNYDQNETVIKSKVTDLYEREQSLRITHAELFSGYSRFLNPVQCKSYVFTTRENAKKRLVEFRKEYKEKIMNDEVLFQTLFDDWIDNNGTIQNECMKEVIKEKFGVEIKSPY